MKLITTALLLGLVSMAAVAQQNPPRATRTPERTSQPTVIGDRTDGSEQQSNLPEEMRIRMAIERADGEHRKILDYVKKLTGLSAEVIASFRERGNFIPDDMKKLGDIQKLAKRILSHAGGNEVDDDPKENSKLTLAEAVDQLQAAVDKISDETISRTRHIVSATVIANSNHVINLTQLIRSKQKNH
jgi:hypothetical protein